MENRKKRLFQLSGGLPVQLPSSSSLRGELFFEAIWFRCHGRNLNVIELILGGRPCQPPRAVVDPASWPGANTHNPFNYRQVLSFNAENQ